MENKGLCMTATKYFLDIITMGFYIYTDKLVLFRVLHKEAFL